MIVISSKAQGHANQGRINTEPSIDFNVFIPSLALVIFVGGALIFFPDRASAAVNAAMTFITTTTGWLYMLLGVVALIFCAWLAFGRYGNVLLGVEGEPPEYSNSHWVAMMFTAGIGASLIVWGFAEPIYYLQTPPFGIEPHSDLAREWAHVYPIFHWALVPWAIYAVPAVPVAYILYRRQDPYLRVSKAMAGSIPGASHPAVAALVDSLIVIGILGGTATSLGFGVPLVSSFLAELAGVDDSVKLKLIVLVIYTLLFGASTYRGLKKGIKILADINMALAVALILLIFVAGPTVFILSMTVNTLGLMTDNFWRMALWTDPISKNGFPEAWTIFYWAWWLAFAAYIGLFIGRISRGRTIRQLVLGVIGWGSLGTVTFLAISGGYVLHLEQTNALPVVEILNAEGGLSNITTAILVHFDQYKIVLGLFFVLALIFYATTLDSAAYVLASVSSKDLHNDQEPSRPSRIIWAAAIGFFTAGLIKVGALETVKAMTIVFSLPLIPIITLMSVSLVKWLREDVGY